MGYLNNIIVAISLASGCKVREPLMLSDASNDFFIKCSLIIVKLLALGVRND